MAANYWRYLAQGAMGGINQLEDLRASGDLPDPATLATLETVARRLNDLVASLKSQARPARPPVPRVVNRRVPPS